MYTLHTRSLDTIERTRKYFEIVNLIIKVLKRCTRFLSDDGFKSATLLTVNNSLALQYVGKLRIMRKALLKATFN